MKPFRVITITPEHFNDSDLGRIAAAIVDASIDDNGERASSVTVAMPTASRDVMKIEVKWPDGKGNVIFFDDAHACNIYIYYADRKALAMRADSRPQNVYNWHGASLELLAPKPHEDPLKPRKGYESPIKPYAFGRGLLSMMQDTEEPNEPISEAWKGRAGSNILGSAEEEKRHIDKRIDEYIKHYQEKIAEAKRESSLPGTPKSTRFMDTLLRVVFDEVAREDARAQEVAQRMKEEREAIKHLRDRLDELEDRHMNLAWEMARLHNAKEPE